MELRVLRYFLAVAREQNITHAAEVLHITQPTLSRQLSMLEEELGVRLMERGARKIILTSEGMLLRRRANDSIARNGTDKIRRGLNMKKWIAVLAALMLCLSVACAEGGKLPSLQRTRTFWWRVFRQPATHGRWRSTLLIT